jgi:EAL and modified HD-GYP domain-containing signal transduction protein
MISEFAAGKPRELSVLCSVRGRLCEHISRMVPGVLPLRAFLTGTLSLLDALLNVRMEDALRQVPLQEDARAALEGRDSPLRTVLDLVVAYEEGDWHKVGELSRLLGVPEEALAPLYVESLEWTRKVFGQAD